MSPLASATLAWIERIYEATGEQDRVVLPAKAYAMLRTELAEEPDVGDGDPITGVGRDGRVWLGATEIVADGGEGR